MTRHQQSSQQNGVPGVWDYVEKKVLRRKPRPLTFEQRAERWLKQVNGATILNDLTHRFRTLRTPSKADDVPTFSEKVFHQSFERWTSRSQHSTTGVPVWDFNSTKSFLATQLPSYTDVPISEATRTIHRSLSYWLQYPMLVGDREKFNEDDMLRATSLLTDSDRTVFRDLNADGADLVKRNEEGEQDYEGTFRSLAVLKPKQRHLREPNADVLGVLHALKPVAETEEDKERGEILLSTKNLEQITMRISESKFPMHAYELPKGEFMSLLGFLIIMLEGVMPQSEERKALLADLTALQDFVKSRSNLHLLWQDLKECTPRAWKAVRAAQRVLFSRLTSTDRQVIYRADTVPEVIMCIPAPNAKSTSEVHTSIIGNSVQLSPLTPAHVRDRRVSADFGSYHGRVVDESWFGKYQQSMLNEGHAKT